MDTKVVLHKARFVVPAGQASANQTLSQLFAKLTINLASFCDDFNEKTAGLDYEEESDLIGEPDDVEDSDILLLAVNIVVYSDKSYTYVIDKPSTSFLILMASEFTQEKKQRVGYISLEDLVVIALFKFEGLNLQSSCSSILGTAKALGVYLK